jgi:hypothetical protein
MICITILVLTFIYPFIDIGFALFTQIILYSYIVSPYTYLCCSSYVLTAITWLSANKSVFEIIYYYLLLFVGWD